MEFMFQTVSHTKVKLCMDVDVSGWTELKTSLTMLWVGRPWFYSRQGLGVFLFTTASRRALGPNHPPIQWVPGVLSLGVKRPECETDNSPPSSAEVRNAWSVTSTPQYAFMTWFSVKAQEQLYLYLWNKTPKEQCPVNTGAENDPQTCS